MKYDPDGDDLGTGRTSQQMREAPTDAVFVWCNDHLGYPINLAAWLGRVNLKIIGPRDLEDDRYLKIIGTRPGAIIVDHAAKLTTRQLDTIIALNGGT